MPREGGCAVVRQGHLIAVVGIFLIGCALLLPVSGCSGVRSEAPQEGQGHSRATTKEQTRSPEATASEETTALEEATTAFEDLQREDVLQAPPDGTLSYAGRELRSRIPGGVCWQTAPDSDWGGCPTDFGPIQIEWQLNKKLYVPSGSQVVFHYEAPRPPNEVTSGALPLLRMRPARNPLNGSLIEGESEPVLGSHSYRLEVHGSGVERTVPVKLPPREYLVFVHVMDPQVMFGTDLEYQFRVKVE
jgi:hypothetical protein